VTFTYKDAHHYRHVVNAGEKMHQRAGAKMHR
jgi:hypothetical protein